MTAAAAPMPTVAGTRPAAPARPVSSGATATLWLCAAACAALALALRLPVATTVLGLVAFGVLHNVLELRYVTGRLRLCPQWWLPGPARRPGHRGRRPAPAAGLDLLAGGRDRALLRGSRRGVRTGAGATAAIRLSGSPPTTVAGRLSRRAGRRGGGVAHVPGVPLRRARSPAQRRSTVLPVGLVAHSARPYARAVPRRQPRLGHRDPGTAAQRRLRPPAAGGPGRAGWVRRRRVVRPGPARAGVHPTRPRPTSACASWPCSRSCRPCTTSCGSGSCPGTHRRRLPASTCAYRCCAGGGPGPWAAGSR